MDPVSSLHTSSLVPDASTVETRFPVVLAEVVLPLKTPFDPSERDLAYGEIENLRIACRKLNRVVIRAEENFGFWRIVGAPRRRRGFRAGRSVREGRSTIETGGGLSRLASALHTCALKAGFKFIENEKNVCWGRADLSFLSDADFAVDTLMNDEELIVRLRGSGEANERRSPTTAKTLLLKTYSVSDTRLPSALGESGEKKAALLTEAAPEFATYLDGEGIDVQLKAWPERLPGFNRFRWLTQARGSLTRVAAVTTVLCAMKLRLSRRVRSLTEQRLWVARALARRYARLLPIDVDHVIVAQDLLPYLWELGVLQGRSFDVLLSRPPLSQEEALTRSADTLFPEAAALRHRFADHELARLESEALAQARRVVTPHAMYAGWFENARQLQWIRPLSEQPADVRRPSYLLFPASLAAREGAHAGLDAAMSLGLTLLVVGRDLEGLATGFDRVEFIKNREIPWNEVAAVVHPALYESWPRLHLRALAIGIPVIATEACGLGDESGVTTVPFGNDEDLRRAILRAMDHGMREFGGSRTQQKRRFPEITG